ncbi:Cys-tRNA(Pro) deacylase [Actinomyces sp. B33]|uniref:Cys-tRNA(Pro) deacylase n=1 Tax=Actinomyces sp. B33 TaxID=2942131 RepID=UPI002340ED64|nr:Cys-tRNA(Pro) deacylase [Actinomyces sp. B33]MDC4232760.1 Cys-tRNA(Pro) deacylase [Actinomyces sp. B33]
MGGSSSAPGRGATPALRALAAAGVDFVVHEYEHSPGERAFGEEAVALLGADPAATFKTLMVECSDGEHVCAVIPVPERLSMKLIARAAGAKSATMADPAKAERLTGYVVGGISPLGQARAHRVFVDSSCLDHDRVIVSGGRRGCSVELAPRDLIEATGARLVDLTAIP